MIFLHKVTFHGKKTKKIEKLEQIYSGLKFKKRKLENYDLEGGEILIKLRTLKTRMEEAHVEKQTLQFQLSRCYDKQQQIVKKFSIKKLYTVRKSTTKTKSKRNKQLILTTKKRNKNKKTKNDQTSTIKIQNDDLIIKTINKQIRTQNKNIKKESKKMESLKNKLENQKRIYQVSIRSTGYFERSSNKETKRKKINDYNRKLTNFTNKVNKLKFQIKQIKTSNHSFLQIKDRERQLHSQIKTHYFESCSLNNKIHWLSNYLQNHKDDKSEGEGGVSTDSFDGSDTSVSTDNDKIDNNIIFSDFTHDNIQKSTPNTENNFPKKFKSPQSKIVDQNIQNQNLQIQKNKNENTLSTDSFNINRSTCPHNNKANGRKMINNKNYNKDQKNNFTKKIQINTFEEILRCPHGINYFTQFLVLKKNEENIYFFQDVKKFKKNCHTTKKVEKSAKKIFNKYIKIDSPFEINIDSNTKKILNKRYLEKNFSLTMFNEAQSIVFKHMKFQAYNIFKKSNLYDSFLKKINNDPKLIRGHNPKKKKCKLINCQNQAKIQVLNGEHTYLGPTNDALEISISLVRYLTNLLNANYSIHQNIINLNVISRTIPFRKFVNKSNELQKINLKALPETEKKCFFLNVYNALMIHSVILYGFPKTNEQISRLEARYQYRINNYIFSLDDIFHGILRTNLVAKHSGTYFKINDPRSNLKLKKLDPRIHFALIKPWKTSNLKIFTTDNLESSLNSLTRQSLGQHVHLSHNRIDMPSIFEEFEKDFIKSVFIKKNKQLSFTHHNNNKHQEILYWISNTLDSKTDLEFLSSSKENTKDSTLNLLSNNPLIKFLQNEPQKLSLIFDPNITLYTQLKKHFFVEKKNICNSKINTNTKIDL
ncbi:electron carrier/ protein disulfide oxidoreductase [Anaeramoeba flamelloides]|uniref:Electron carrier/ protein disulfide oxidoreductase n=1 Tax=Anaeramoeba flamelloides TaxID=1746091 RepID=A0ABQ8Z998_9EUKA|nr:electron carrier/ protein disulfide oxidoreductase [Anaeramoeba flamelloides]